MDETKRTKHNEYQIDYFEQNYKKTMQPAVGTPYSNRQVDELVQYANLQKDELILDVGCGIGRYTLPLAERGFNVEGLDLTQGLLDQLHEHDGGRYNISLYCADVLNPPEELVGKYDVLVGFFTLHHLHDIHACYASMINLLKPGGRIIFLEPNAYNPLYYVQIALTPRMTWDGDGGVRLMRRGYIFDAMEKAGFENLSIERFGFFPPMIVNRPGGQTVESIFESIPIWKPILPFQMFMGYKPNGAS